MGLLRFFATLIFVLSVPVALVTTNIRWVANEGRVYRYSIDEFNAVETTGIARDDLLRGSAELRDYFNNGQDTVTIRVGQGGQERNLFNPRETAHLKDVKDRFQLVARAQEFSVLYVLSYIAVVVLWARELSPRALAVRVILGCTIGLAVVGALAGLGFAGFDSAWVRFHEIMFSNDFWRLNPANDHLIQMFPPEFWESIVFFIGVLCIAETALLLIGAMIYLGVSGHQPRKPLAAGLLAGV